MEAISAGRRQRSRTWRPSRACRWTSSRSRWRAATTRAATLQVGDGNDGTEVHDPRRAAEELPRDLPPHRQRRHARARRSRARRSCTTRSTGSTRGSSSTLLDRLSSSRASARGRSSISGVAGVSSMTTPTSTTATRKVPYILAGGAADYLKTGQFIDDRDHQQQSCSTRSARQSAAPTARGPARRLRRRRPRRRARSTDHRLKSKSPDVPEVEPPPVRLAAQSTSPSSIAQRGNSTRTEPFFSMAARYDVDRARARDSRCVRRWGRQRWRRAARGRAGSAATRADEAPARRAPSTTSAGTTSRLRQLSTTGDQRARGAATCAAAADRTRAAAVRTPRADTSTRSRRLGVPREFVGNITTRGAVRDGFASTGTRSPENEGKWGEVERPQEQGLEHARQDLQVRAGQQRSSSSTTSSCGAATNQPEVGRLCEGEAAGGRAGLDEVVLRALPQDEVHRRRQRAPPHTTPSYKNGIGGDGASGWDWIVNSFKWAREFCPNAVLILNDYNNIEYQNDHNNFMRSRGR